MHILSICLVRFANFPDLFRTRFPFLHGCVFAGFLSQPAAPLLLILFAHCTLQYIENDIHIVKRAAAINKFRKGHCCWPCLSFLAYPLSPYCMYLYTRTYISPNVTKSVYIDIVVHTKVGVQTKAESDCKPCRK